MATDLIDDLSTDAGDRPDTPPEDIDDHGNSGVPVGAGDDTEADGERPKVYGDSSYGTGEFHQHLADHDIDDRCKTQQRGGHHGMFHKDAFHVDLEQDTVGVNGDDRVQQHEGERVVAQEPGEERLLRLAGALGGGLAAHAQVGEVGGAVLGLVAEVGADDSVEDR